jgi:hypothetical protein
MRSTTAADLAAACAAAERTKSASGDIARRAIAGSLAGLVGGAAGAGIGAAREWATGNPDDRQRKQKILRAAGRGAGYGGAGGFLAGAALAGPGRREMSSEEKQQEIHRALLTRFGDTPMVENVAREAAGRGGGVLAATGDVLKGAIPIIGSEPNSVYDIPVTSLPIIARTLGAGRAVRNTGVANFWHSIGGSHEGTRTVRALAHAMKMPSGIDYSNSEQLTPMLESVYGVGTTIPSTARLEILRRIAARHLSGNRWWNSPSSALSTAAAGTDPDAIMRALPAWTRFRLRHNLLGSMGDLNYARDVGKYMDSQNLDPSKFHGGRVVPGGMMYGETAGRISGIRRMGRDLLLANYLSRVLTGTIRRSQMVGMSDKVKNTLEAR